MDTITNIKEVTAMKDFKQKFNALLTTKLNINQELLKPGTSFFDLGANSLDMVEVIIEFEKAFDITIPDEDAEKFLTVGDAENYIKKRLNINN
jgi:acyl carrier protein